MESVWDYPRPPRLERSTRRVRVRLGGVTIADSDAALPRARDQPPAGALRAAGGHRRRGADTVPAGAAHAVRVEGHGHLPRRPRRRARRDRGGLDLPRAGARLRTRCATTSPSTPAAWTSACSTTSASAHRRATSTAAGSPPTSRARSRAPREREAGSHGPRRALPRAGEGLRPRRLRPGRQGGPEEGRRREAPRGRPRAPGRPPGAPVRRGPAVAAGGAPGDGRRRQGRHDRPRDERAQPAGRDA